MPKGIYQRTIDQKFNISIALMGNKNCLGNKNTNWKGDEVGYNALHSWVGRHLGKAQQCEHCGKIKTTPKSVQWANIGHSYKRNLTDWIALCAKCHEKYDIINNFKKQNDK